MKMELLTFSLILYQSKNCGHRIHVSLYGILTPLISNQEMRMGMDIVSYCPPFFKIFI
jgi:hypothetical protein